MSNLQTNEARSIVQKFFLSPTNRKIVNYKADKDKIYCTLQTKVEDKDQKSSKIHVTITEEDYAYMKNYVMQNYGVEI